MGFGRGTEATRIETDVDADGPNPPMPDLGPQWKPILAWGAILADGVALDQPAEHVGVFVLDPEAGALRLVGQIWGSDQNTGEVRVGEWLVPLEGSICGRVFRTGEAALSADFTLDPDERSFPGSSTRSSLTVPIRAAEGIVGVVTVEAPWIAAFSIADYDRLTATVSSAAAGFPSLRRA